MHIKVDQTWYKTEKRADVQTIKSYHEQGILNGGVIACMPDDDPEVISRIMVEDLPFCYLVISVKREWLALDEMSLTKLFNSFKHKYRTIGIKIHPRFSQVSLEDTSVVGKLIRAAHQCNMLVYICTIIRSPVGPAAVPPHYRIARIAESHSEGDIVFLHGGYTDVFHTGEIIRDYPNAWLDLSFTFMRFRKSSISLDCGYLMETLDRKLMIGTDFPEYTPKELLRALDDSVFQRQDLELTEEKISNVLSENIRKLVSKYDPAN
jgi:hypothetical protein